MELTTYRFDNKNKLTIINIGDVHYGNVNCDRQGFKKIVDYIKQNDNVYWVSTGDILEVATKNSKSFDYKAMNLHDELNEVIDILKPINNKCLGITGSNHHYRIEKETGLNLDAILAEMLEVPYLGYTGFLRVIVGNTGYFLCMHHNVGFGKSRGAKTNNLQRLGDIYRGYDVYLSGHTHCYNYFIDTNIILDRKHYTNMSVIAHYVTTGHYLDYKGSYAEKGLLTPAPKGSAFVTLYGNNSNKKKIEVGFLEV